MLEGSNKKYETNESIEIQETLINEEQEYPMQDYIAFW